MDKNMKALRTIRDTKLSVQHYLVDLQNFCVVKIVTFGFKSIKVKSPLQRLGSSYGGWFIPTDAILENFKSKLLISVGLGHDVTFDKLLLDRNFTVLGLDPIEECVDYAKSQLGSRNVTLLKCGLSTFSGTQTFYPPKNSEHDAWSSTNAQNVSTQKAKAFEVICFEDLYSKYCQEKNDFLILKMDIEGGEEAILHNFNLVSHTIEMLAVEMDFLSLLPFRSLTRRVAKIRSARIILQRLRHGGFHFVHSEGFNFFWLHESFSEKLLHA